MLLKIAEAEKENVKIVNTRKRQAGRIQKSVELLWKKMFVTFVFYKAAEAGWSRIAGIDDVYFRQRDEFLRKGFVIKVL